MALKKLRNFWLSPSKKKWTCPTFSVPKIVVLKPPLFNQNLAALLACGHHGAFFDHHGQRIKFAINQKIGRNCKGQVVIG